MKLWKQCLWILAQAACTFAVAQPPVSAHEAEYAQAAAAYQKQDFATVIRLLQPLAEQGDATAQHNYEKAAFWYRKAAEQGHADAQNNLAARYATGTGVTKDLAEALKWYRAAAAQGHPTAGHTLQQLERLPEAQKQPAR